MRTDYERGDTWEAWDFSSELMKENINLLHENQ